MKLRPAALAAFVVGFLSATAPAAVVFEVSLPKEARDEPATGRVVVFLIKDGAGSPRARPIQAPFWENPQPMFGAEVRELAPGGSVTLEDPAQYYPTRLAELAPGSYSAQAALIVTRSTSEWKREDGNLYSKPVSFDVKAGDAAHAVAFALTEKTRSRPITPLPTAEVFELRSEILSGFHGSDVYMRAGVIFPKDRDPAKKYAAVYEIPGFGGDHTSALSRRNEYAREGDPGLDELKKLAFWIVLDPESPNGHTLFADSDNNGPVARALVTEFLPALEAKYNLVADPKARLLRGHSSGGWSSIWLAITKPDVFGGCWSSSPDPVDFRRFQLVDIYAQSNMYSVTPEEIAAKKLTQYGQPTALVAGERAGISSFRSGNGARMTIRDENLMEEVLGPWNTAGQQWDSWQAVFGPRAAGGIPAALYDPATGVIDHEVANLFRRYDICAKLRDEPGVYGPIFKQRVRIIVGDQDSFYLNEAVSLLKEEVDKLSFLALPEGEHGYIKVLPGFDHGTIFGAAEMRGMAGEMADAIGRQ
jgi:hypothetical protein